MRLAVFPGTFDPFTLGHQDVLSRALLLFDRVEVTVAVNPGKNPVLSLEERCRLISDSMAGTAGVGVSPFEGLLVNRARELRACALVRGLRQVSDFDYELRMAVANRRMYPELETIFLMPSEEYAFVSGSLVREIYQLGGDIAPFVPEPVYIYLKEKRDASLSSPPSTQP
jgi:pantetheine-phosphate adenylyltransferase